MRTLSVEVPLRLGGIFESSVNNEHGLMLTPARTTMILDFGPIPARFIPPASKFHIGFCACPIRDCSPKFVWPALSKVVGFSFGLVGIFLLIWSLFKQGVSLLGVGLLAAGFLMLLIASFLQ
jgi:hypothetical protein